MNNTFPAEGEYLDNYESTYPVNADWKEVFAVIDNMMTELP